MLDDATATATADDPSNIQEGGETQQAPPETPWFQKIFNPERPGEFVDKYQEMLPDDFNDYKGVLTNYRDMKGMAKSIKDLMTQARNGKGLRPLTAESTPEEISTYRAALGIPETPYEFEKPKELPPGIEWPEDRVKKFGEFAQSKNMTKEQAEAALQMHLQFLSEDYSSAEASQKQQHEANLAAEREFLTTKYGGKLDGEVTQAKRVMLKYNLPPDLMEPNSPQFMGATLLGIISDMAKTFDDSKLPSAAAVVNTNPLRQATAMREKGHPDFDALNRGDKATMDKYYELLRQAKEQGLIPPG